VFNIKIHNKATLYAKLKYLAWEPIQQRRGNWNGGFEVYAFLSPLVHKETNQFIIPHFRNLGSVPPIKYATIN